MYLITKTIWCVCFIHICWSLDTNDKKRSVIKGVNGKGDLTPHLIRRLKRQAYSRRDGHGEDSRYESRGNYIERPNIQSQHEKTTDIRHQPETFDFPFFPNFNNPTDGDNNDPNIFATPDGFPINPEDFGLDWETLLNEPSIDEIHANLTNLEKTVILVQDDQYNIKRNVDRVLEEMGTLQAEMYKFQRAINDSFTSVMKSLGKYDRSLRQGTRIREKLQRQVSVISDMPVSQNQILYMKNVSELTKEYTQKHIKKVRKKINSLETHMSKFRLAWGNRLKDVSSVVRDVRGTGKQHTIAIDYLFSNVSSLKNGVKGIQRSSNSIYHRGGCDSGTESFVNYPFNSGNWPQTKKIRFRQKFPFEPSVAYGVTAMDTSYKYNTRLRIQVNRVTQNGFILYCSGWHNSRLYQVEVAWMAC